MHFLGLVNGDVLARHVGVIDQERGRCEAGDATPDDMRFLALDALWGQCVDAVIVLHRSLPFAWVRNSVVSFHVHPASRSWPSHSIERAYCRLRYWLMMLSRRLGAVRSASASRALRLLWTQSEPVGHSAEREVTGLHLLQEIAQ